MGVFLSHIDLQPLFYGFIITVGLIVVAYHIFTFKIMAVLVDIAVFVLVFWMHGGTLTGGMAAAVAALLAGLIIPPLIRRLLK